MATRVTRSKSQNKPRKNSAANEATKALAATEALYLYGVSAKHEHGFEVANEGVDGRGNVQPIACGDWVCWTSRVSRDEFADNLQSNLENLDWLASCSIRHQKVLAEIGRAVDILPARFGVVFLSEKSLCEHVRQRESTMRESLKRIEGAEEWGVKVFAVRASKSATEVRAASGSDYLRKKAEAFHRPPDGDDAASSELLGKLQKVSVAAVPGGKASRGQANLLWSGSFLVKRSQLRKFEQAIREFAERWGDSRRIETSGPWPPYSFVGDDVR